MPVSLLRVQLDTASQVFVTLVLESARGIEDEEENEDEDDLKTRVFG